MITITIGSEESGMRLDRLLRKKLSLLKLSDIYSLIRKGGVKVNGKRSKQDYRLVEGDSVVMDVNPSEMTAPKEFNPDTARQLTNTEFFKRNFKVIFEDADLLACDKPPGLVVHPGTGHLQRDTLIDLAVAYMSGKRETTEPVLVHRLDRDTSGVILLAKSKRIVRELNEIFRGRKVEKEYRCICHRRPPQFEGTVELGMSRTDHRNTGMKMHVDDEGGFSRTRYRMIEHHGGVSKLEVFLDTGKTHQIRVHMAHLHAPIIGDVRYGDEALDAALFKKGNSLPRRLYLHAHRLSFSHPSNGRRITITAPEPKEFKDLMGRAEQ